MSWREGATSTHDFLAFPLVVMIAGHVVMALTHRDELLSIFKGTVAVEWARRHTPEWLEEEGRTSQCSPIASELWATSSWTNASADPMLPAQSHRWGKTAVPDSARNWKS